MNNVVKFNPLITAAKKAFCDSIKLKVRGGNGGTGLPIYGGVGGEGGDVYIAGTTTYNTSLSRLKKEYPSGLIVAGNGVSSRKSRLVGLKGDDKVIQVPFGITIHDEQKQLIGEINEPKDKICVAMGGRGGDKFNENHGYVGQTRIITLDLKMISDAGFVGFPNAGKSTLLGAVSRASPKVASYPFTTLRPWLGVVKYDDLRSITLTDLPGLIEGAHRNIGLGHHFLKHVARNRILIYTIEINNVDLGPSYPLKTPIEALRVLRNEIELYDDHILNKPSILLVTKVDNPTKQMDKFLAIKDDIEYLYKFDHILPISVHSGYNIKKFTEILRETIDGNVPNSSLIQ